MSHTSVPYPCAAPPSRADPSAGALVMSISSGAATTGTPLTTSKGNLASPIWVTSRGRGHGPAPVRPGAGGLVAEPGSVWWFAARDCWPDARCVHVQQLEDPACRGAERA